MNMITEVVEHVREFCSSCTQPPGSKLTQHSQQLAVRNVSPLPVTALLLCEYPFSLLSGGTAHTQMVGNLICDVSQTSKPADMMFT